MGEHGVRHVLKGLLADWDIFMNFAGLNRGLNIHKSLIKLLSQAYTLPQKSKVVNYKVKDTN